MQNKVNYYGDYLKIDQLLSAQLPISQATENTHDEMLFIIVHQAFELWFKQMLHELNAILSIFSRPRLCDNDIFRVMNGLLRIIEIMRLIMGQFTVLKTMTPMDFLEFRGLLGTASGLQSFQFRMLEAKMGVYDQQVQAEIFFLQQLNPHHKAQVQDSLAAPSLFKSVESWLERIPFLQTEHFSFLAEYQSALMQMLDEDEKNIANDAHVHEAERKVLLQQINQNRNYFNSIFNEEIHQQRIVEKSMRMSFKATVAALFIFVYRDEPALQAPYRLLAALVEIDELFTQWRHNHVLMVSRMIGTKVGTGGTSGMDFLKKAADKNKVFTELANLSTYLIPRTRVPELPSEYKIWLGLNYQHPLDYLLSNSSKINSGEIEKIID